MGRVERKLVATRVDHRLTFTEVIEFLRDGEAAGVDPGSWLKIASTLKGYAREITIVPDPDRQQEQDSPGGGTES